MSYESFGSWNKKPLQKSLAYRVVLLGRAKELLLETLQTQNESIFCVASEAKTIISDTMEHSQVKEVLQNS